MTTNTTSKAIANPSTGLSGTASAAAPAGSGVFQNSVAPSGFSGVITSTPLNVPNYARAEIKKITSYYIAASHNLNANERGGNQKVLDRIGDAIQPVGCADYEVEAGPEITGPKSGKLVIRGHATGGTGFLFRVYEFPAIFPDLTAPSEEDVEANGTLRVDVAFAGPFSPDCPLEIPFTFEGTPENIQFFADFHAETTPMEIACQGDGVLTVVPCSNVSYPEFQVTGGCGPYTNIFNPPANQLTPGVPTPVHVVAYDSKGSTAECTFFAVRESLGWSGFKSPIAYGNNNEGKTCQNPLKPSNLGRTVPIKFTVTCDGSVTTTATPILDIDLYDGTSCTKLQDVITETHFRILSSRDYQFQWDTRNLPTGDNFVYAITVDLGDGAGPREPTFLVLK
jgi:hypothetical protein